MNFIRTANQNGTLQFGVALALVFSVGVSVAATSPGVKESVRSGSPCMIKVGNQLVINAATVTSMKLDGDAIRYAFGYADMAVRYSNAVTAATGFENILKEIEEKCR